MRDMLIGAAACASALLIGYGCAFADDAGNKAKDETLTVNFKTVDRQSGYAIPDFETLKYSILIVKYAKEYDVPVELARAVVRVESNFDPDALGSAGEVGLMQIKPATARMMGYTGTKKDLFDPETNIKYGMKYLAGAHELGGGETCGTILKYNAGHAAKRMNPVSKAYCGKVLALMQGAPEVAETASISNPT
ncbi:lytic transglycosylase domain-containing protein [Rhizobium sp. P32RR-XVIII]|uniref:lytic transglycosylase domain-containing protein n=1 Tax=Rhizobium sp. P32RR-XVIII TaxID=2726738 RepID=UPI0014562FEE|nr:lytic transglycosylase domain-containing protein [Rhizobium sp. P32RR-XVIII]NLS04677.1 lytic transglycosylase domain-containing protein [Rhizobium sp. P32RR-XVIII]